MSSAVYSALFVLAMAGNAAAQPGLAPPSASPPQPALQGDELSETTALWLSLGGTAASWTLVALAADMDHRGSSKAGDIATIGAFGTLFAPSFGHWYARSLVTRGLGLRLAGAAAVFVGLGVVVGCDGECSGSEVDVALALALAGTGLYVGGTIDDIATAPGRARSYNHRFQNVAVVPMIRRDNSGFMITGRF
jgi:hypothetical protein